MPFISAAAQTSAVVGPGRAVCPLLSALGLFGRGDDAVHASANRLSRSTKNARLLTPAADARRHVPGRRMEQALPPAAAASERRSAAANGGAARTCRWPPPEPNSKPDIADQYERESDSGSVILRRCSSRLLLGQTPTRQGRSSSTQSGAERFHPECRRSAAASTRRRAPMWRRRKRNRPRPFRSPRQCGIAPALARRAWTDGELPGPLDLPPAQRAPDRTDPCCT